MASGAYPFDVARRAPHVKITQQACPGLAGAVEADASREEIGDMVGKAVLRLRPSSDDIASDSAASPA